MNEEEELFIDRFYTLAQLRNTPSLPATRQISQILRLLFIDDYPLVHRINKKYKIKLRFSVIEPTPSESNKVQFLQLDNVPRVDLREAQFLSRALISIDGRDITVREAIKHFANKSGGVHYDPVDNDFPYSVPIDTQGRKLGDFLINQIVWTCFNALIPLCDAILPPPRSKNMIYIPFGRDRFDRGKMIFDKVHCMHITPEMRPINRHFEWHAIISLPPLISEVDNGIIFTLGNEEQNIFTVSHNCNELQFVFRTQQGRENILLLPVETKFRMQNTRESLIQYKCWQEYDRVYFCVSNNKQKLCDDISQDALPNWWSWATLGAARDESNGAVFGLAELCIISEKLSVNDYNYLVRHRKYRFSSYV